MSEPLESVPVLAQLSQVLDQAPENLATGSKSLQDAALQATKYLFDISVESEASSYAHINPLLNSFSPSNAPQTRSQTRKRKRSPSPPPPQISIQPTPLNSLFVEGLDEDQIWSQLDLRGKNICEMLDRVLEPEPEENDDEDGGIPNELDLEKAQEFLERLKNGEEFDLEEYGLDEDSLVTLLEQSGYLDDEDSEDESGEEEDSEDDEDETGEEFPDEEAGALRDESSGEEEEEEEEPQSMLDVISNKRRAKRSSSELDDGFFDLTTFNVQSDAAEARKVSSGRLDESDDEDDEAIDFFASVDDDDIEEEQALYYNDFFKPPRFEKTSEAKKKSDTSSVRFHDEVRVKKIEAKGKGKPVSSMYEDDDEDEDEDVDEGGGLMFMDEGGGTFPEESDDEDFEADEESEEDFGMDNTIQRLQDDLFADEEDDSQKELTTHEKRMQALKQQIVDLEQENVGEKDWVLMGEADSRSRPQNSLLEEDLEFERIQKSVPVITEEAVQGLEERIKARILENQFDDVVRIRPLEDKPFLPSRFFELKDTKSNQSLAQIYEDEYVAAQGSSTGDAIDEKLRKEHEEVEHMWEGICSKLDALCNAYYTPKQPKATISTVANVSTASLESALPTTQSAGTMLAPEEVFAPSSSDPRAKSELTPAEKQTLRRKERKARKKTRDALNVGVDKYAKAKKVGGIKRQKEDALKSVVKSGKGVTVVGKKKKDILAKSNGKRGTA